MAFHRTWQNSKHGAKRPHKPSGLLRTERRRGAGGGGGGRSVEEGDYISITTLSPPE